MNDNTAPLLQLTGVTKAFGANRALQGVDLTVNQGDSLVLIGSSGSGKTLAAFLSALDGLLAEGADCVVAHMDALGAAL